MALDFQRAFSNAVRAVKEGKFSGPITTEDLLETARDAQIFVVEDSLLVTLDGSIQSSIATNDPDKLLIRINRMRWERLKDERLKEAVALHEVLSLRRIERTGNYAQSARYLEAFGISPWLISGTKEDPSLDPKPKKMSCEISYVPDPNNWNSRIVMNFEQMTADNDDTRPHSLSVRKTITTKDGRFDIYLWGVQPFRNAYLPFPHEFTSISIVDKKRKVSIGVGPNAVVEGAEANEDMRDSRASYIPFNDDASRDMELMLNVKCSLK
ncbi:MAG: hypothetical protein EOP11_21330 [Proteobacteria bacterium]|nr:MAG: hypothetical protein EOP11_21330 [Pseudomonadota bacterium]